MKILEENSNFELCARIHKDCKPKDFAHWHSNLEIFQLLEGNCEFLADGHIYSLNAGDIMIIKEQCIHKYLTTPLCFRIVQFSSKLFYDLSKPFVNLKPYITLQEIRSIPRLEETLSSFFELMDFEPSEKNAEDNPFFQSLVLAMYSLLARYFSEDENNNPSKDQKKYFFEIITYINNHYKEGISVQSISKALYISRNRLTQIFVKYSGMSVTDYIINLRLKKSKLLLTQGHTVIDSALESGFPSARTFYNVFKSSTGLTPMEYVKEHKTENNM